MGKWDRDTPWRQGQFLPADAMAAFGLWDGTDANEVVAVVISHDCDLAQPAVNEPCVEVIVGKTVGVTLNGNYTHCKNLRKLHIACSAGTRAEGAELIASERRFLPKDTGADGGPSLGEFSPNSELRLAPDQRNTLQRWLAARYRRAAFPDEFDRRLSEETTVYEKLGRAFKDSGEHIVAVFFDVDEGAEVKRVGAGDIYELHITLLYTTSVDPAVAEKAGGISKARVEEIFTQQCFKAVNGVRSWHWVELVGVEVLADTALTYAQSEMLSKWHADHVSLKTDPPQPIFGD